MKMREDIRPVTYLKSKAAAFWLNLTRLTGPWSSLRTAKPGLSFKTRKVMSERRQPLD